MNAWGWVGDMDKISWWASSIVSGVLLVWVAEFLRKKAAGVISKLVERWNLRTEKKKEEWKNLIEYASENQHYWSHIQQNELRLRMNAIVNICGVIGTMISLASIRIVHGHIPWIFAVHVLATFFFAIGAIRLLIKAETARQLISQAFTLSEKKSPD